ncbi:hypothetical protein ACFFRR_007437 [Megaselia abdita]
MSTLYLILTFLIIIVTLLVYWVKNLYSYWERRGIPHDSPSFPVGNMGGDTGKEELWFGEAFDRIYQKYRHQGPFAGLYFFINKAIITTDLNLVQDVLVKDFNNFVDRGRYYNEKDDPLTAHLFSLSGQKWRNLRQKVSPTFSSGKMKFMFPTIVEVSKGLSETMKNRLEKDSNVEIRDLMSRYTTDVIGSVAFGIDVNTMGGQNETFLQMGKRSFNDSRHPQFIEGFIQLFPNAAKKLRMKLIPDDVHEFFTTLVRDTIHLRENGNIQRNDFLNLLLELRKNKDTHLTFEEIAAQAFLFFGAGYDTSANTISYCLYELAQNQEIQDQLRKEIIDTLNKHNGELSYESIKDMVYLDKVSKETSRKYSIVPFLIRVCENDYKIRDTNLVIEKDTFVIIPITSIQKDPEYYPEPEKFDPERFSEEDIQSRHPCAYLPFGDGPRICIGMRFARMQTAIALITLLREFKFSVGSKTEIPITYDKENIFLVPLKGLHVKVERI